MSEEKGEYDAKEEVRDAMEMLGAGYERNELLEAILELKAHLSPGGDYSICRTDGQGMGLGDQLVIGEAMDKVSLAIKKVTA